MKALTFASLVLISFTSFAQNYNPYFANKKGNQKWVDSVFKTLSPEERITQLIMVAGVSDTKRALIDTTYSREAVVKEYIAKYKIGGVVFFQGSPVKQALLTNEYQKLSKVPLMIALDGEWGLNMRLDSTLRLPYQMTMGAIQDNFDAIYDMGKYMAAACKRLGVHVNFAPTVDVNNNAKNPVINFRSFGENPDEVFEKSFHYMRGMQDGGLMTTLKHFPGHGDTEADSHYGLPVIKHNKEHLDQVELYPFKKLIEAGADGVMIAHLSIPSLDTTANRPSTLSKKIVTDLLKKELGFKGLVYSDAMNMSGVTKYFKKGRAEVEALKAGMDVLEFVPNIPDAVEAIKMAIQTGELTQDQIDEKCRKVLMAKSWAGLDHYQPVDVFQLTQDLNNKEADAINRKLHMRSLTLLKNENDLLPIRDFTKKIQVISLEAESETAFQKMFKNYTDVSTVALKKDADLTTVLQSQADVHLIGLHLGSITPGRANYGLNDWNIGAIEKLGSLPNAVLVVFGNAYTLDKLRGIDKYKSIIMAYQKNTHTEELSAQAIMGALGFTGKLPVTVNNVYKKGDGIKTKSLETLQYGPAEMVGLNSKRLEFRIDDLVQMAIEEKATPGAVVEVVKDGMVIFKKAYGSQGYENTALPLKETDLFDLASITKISTSALGIMQMVDAGKMNLDDKISKYFPAFTDSNKENMELREMLTHKAGLKAWIPFWTGAIDSLAIVMKSDVFKQEYAKKFRAKLLERVFQPELRMTRIKTAIKADKDLWAKCFKPEAIIWKPNTFSADSSQTFPVYVAPKMYLHKDYRQIIFDQIKESPVDPKKAYVYSDMGFYLYPEIIEKLTGENWESYLKNTYKKLGANSLTYNPRRFFPLTSIVPTEKDTIFRKTHIHGYVHDEGAGMLNGISGHAGLFGNANDLTKLMYLYLKNGKYAGQQLIAEKTVKEFTTYQYPDHHRGIAFEKPLKNRSNTAASCTDASYGHSGFTGTYTWVDPEYNLIFTMMTNRVNPTRDNRKLITKNYRTNILEAIYTEIKVKD